MLIIRLEEVNCLSVCTNKCSHTFGRNQVDHASIIYISELYSSRILTFSIGLHQWDFKCQWSFVLISLRIDSRKIIAMDLLSDGTFLVDINQTISSHWHFEVIKKIFVIKITEEEKYFPSTSMFFHEKDSLFELTIGGFTQILIHSLIDTNYI